MFQNYTKTRVVGVDIRMEKTSCAIVDIRGNLIATDSLVTIDYPDIGNYVTALSECIVRMLEGSGGYDSVRSVGISVPSGNFQSGCIVNSPNMPWKGIVPLAAMLRDRLGIAVALANNAHIMALGEQAFGAAHGMKDFIVITLGHGFGSCFFSNGRAHLGADGFAGEIGHTCVVHNGRECGCGKRGCLEAYVATKGIVRTARELMEERQDPSPMRQVADLTPRMITAFCEQGDQLAIETYRRTGRVLGFGLANYASVINPEAIIFTGGISHADKWLVEPTSEAFEAHVFHNIKDKVKFIISGLDDDLRNMLGASVLAWEVKEYSLFK